jgi:DNA-directed RNA polymerase beta' subunit
MDKDRPSHQIDYVRFDMYDPETIKKISACKITESVAYDNLNNPIKKGLHDPLLGISAYDRQNSNCALCGLDNESCPGHFGHVELAAPVYNPLLLKILHRLLNAKCFNCHGLKIRGKEKAYIFLKFVLLKLGLIQEANILEGIVHNVEAHSDVVKKIVEFIWQITGKKDCFIADEENNNIHGRLGSIDTINTDDTGTEEKIKKKKPKENSEKNEELRKIEVLMKESMKSVNSVKIDEILAKVSEKMKIKNPILLQDQNLNVQIVLK